MKVAIALSIAGLTWAYTTAAHADDDGPREVRLRALYLDPANHSDAYAPLGIPKDAIHIDSKWLPDLDFEYFFTPNWSSELLLTYPQKQTVTIERSVLGGPTDVLSWSMPAVRQMIQFD